MEISDFSHKNKAVAVSPALWQKLKTAAYEQNTQIKQIFEQIMFGSINPVTMKPTGRN
jgi:hypothetical protein